MEIGERIKNRRLELKLTVDELADILGKNRATVYRYENGDIENLPISIVEPLAAALCTTPSYLMGWTDDYIDYKNTDEYMNAPLAVIEHLKDPKKVYQFMQAQKIDAISEMSRMRGTIVKPLTYRQQQIVSLFSRLTESQQDNIIGRAELLVEQNEEASNQESV